MFHDRMEEYELKKFTNWKIARMSTSSSTYLVHSHHSLRSRDHQHSQDHHIQDLRIRDLHSLRNHRDHSLEWKLSRIYKNYLEEPGFKNQVTCEARKVAKRALILQKDSILVKLSFSKFTVINISKFDTEITLDLTDRKSYQSNWSQKWVHWLLTSIASEGNTTGISGSDEGSNECNESESVHLENEDLVNFLKSL